MHINISTANEKNNNVQPWIHLVAVVDARIFCSFLTGQSYEVRMLDNRNPGELPELNNKLVKVSLFPDTELLSSRACA